MTSKELASKSIIGAMKLADEEIPLRRCTRFVPAPDTEGRVDDPPFPAARDVELIHYIIPVARIMDSMIVEVMSALSAVQRFDGDVRHAVCGSRGASQALVCALRHESR